MRTKFGQYEDFDPGMWESYYEPVDLYSTEWPSEAGYIYPTQEWPSETRYVDIYGQQVTADGAVVSGSSLLDVVKSIFGIAAPVVTSALTAEQAERAAEARTAATAAAQTTAVQTSTTSPLTASMLSGITSNLPILAVVVIGGFLLLSKEKGKKSRRRR